MPDQSRRLSKQKLKRSPRCAHSKIYLTWSILFLLYPLPFKFVVQFIYFFTNFFKKRRKYFKCLIVCAESVLKKSGTSSLLGVICKQLHYQPSSFWWTTSPLILVLWCETKSGDSSFWVNEIFETGFTDLKMMIRTNSVLIYANKVRSSKFFSFNKVFPEEINAESILREGRNTSWNIFSFSNLGIQMLFVPPCFLFFSVCEHSLFLFV